MPGKLILAIDQGTTNTKVLLIDRSGAVVARASHPLSIQFPQPAWVEQDARALWTSVVEAMVEVLARVPDAEIAAIGISNQRESVIAWERRTGEPVGPCVVWQCRRTAPFCDQLRARGLDPFLRERTGLPVDPLFSASKASWLLDAAPGGRARAASGDLCIGTVDSWLLWNLTGGAVHATDATNASRTQLMNLAGTRWDPELLALFDIPEVCLPTVRASSGLFGHTAGIGSLPAGVPVGSLIGDSHAAMFGHASFRAGATKATYGTGSSLMMLTPSVAASSHGLAGTVAWRLDDKVQYALEGNITNTGGAVQWIGEFLGLPQPAEGAASMAETVADSGGVYVVPAFAGLGAPHWDAGARGLIFGLTRGSTAAHVARATVDAIAYQVHDVFDAMQKDAAGGMPELLADGGASRNDSLMQFQADILGCPVVRSTSADLSACGAGWLAGLAADYWGSLAELQALPRETRRFEPRMEPRRRRELLSGWNDAVARARSVRNAPDPALAAVCGAIDTHAS
jgi:glycerol kinase